MFAFIKKLFGTSAKAEVKVNPVIARTEAAKVEKKPPSKKPAVKAKTAKTTKKPKNAG